MRLTLFELIHHDVAGRHRHIVGRVLLRISWCDDGHEVVPVTRGHLRELKMTFNGGSIPQFEQKGQVLYVYRSAF